MDHHKKKIIFNVVSAIKKKLSQNVIQHFSEFSASKHQENLCEQPVTDYCALGWPVVQEANG